MRLREKKRNMDLILTGIFIIYFTIYAHLPPFGLFAGFLIKAFPENTDLPCI